MARGWSKARNRSALGQPVEFTDDAMLDPAVEAPVLDKAAVSAALMHLDFKSLRLRQLMEVLDRNDRIVCRGDDAGRDTQASQVIAGHRIPLQIGLQIRKLGQIAHQPVGLFAQPLERKPLLELIALGIERLLE